jgi:hypothetical protein
MFFVRRCLPEGHPLSWKKADAVHGSIRDRLAGLLDMSERIFGDGVQGRSDRYQSLGLHDEAAAAGKFARDYFRFAQ